MKRKEKKRRREKERDTYRPDPGLRRKVTPGLLAKIKCSRGASGGTMGKKPPANVGNTRHAVSFTVWRRSPGVGNGNPLQ